MQSTTDRHLQNTTALWQRARVLYGLLIGRFGGAQRYAYGRCLGKQRRDLERWLKPVEKLVRSLLFIGAVTHLLMTTRGRRLMKTSQKIDLSGAQKAASTTIRIPHPGWHTIAQTRTREPDPPPCEVVAPAEAVVEPADAWFASAPSAGAPENWRVSFRVLRPPSTPFPVSRSPLRALTVSFDNPRVQAALAEHAARKAREAEAAQDGQGPTALAKRIEALGRVFRDPEGRMRRLAVFIARIAPAAIALAPPRTVVDPVHCPFGWCEMEAVFYLAIVARRILALSG